MEKQVFIKIKNCRKCPNCRIEPFYTEDSFENVEEWFCLKKAKKHITYYETFDKNPDIPDWCPIREKKV